MPIDSILVPQGPEHQSVLKGLKGAAIAPRVVAIPIGPQAVARALTHPATCPGKRVLVAGLCGSLSAARSVGAIVLYADCIDLQNDSAVLAFDGPLTGWIQQKLQGKAHTEATIVRGLASDRWIHRAAEKRQLQERFEATVVDMEGASVLRSLGRGRAVAMLRVVGDDCRGDLPDLAGAIDAEGQLRPFPLLKSCLRQPVAAARLVGGSLRGLAVLQAAIAELFAARA